MPQPHVLPYTGRIIVRLKSEFTDSLRNKYAEAVSVPAATMPFPNLGAAAAHLVLTGVSGYLLARPYLTTERLMSDASVPRVLTYEAQAVHSLLPPLRSLLLYYVVDARRRYQPGSLTSIAAEIRELSGVDTAYPERGVKLASNGGSCPASAQNQEYLDGAASGLPDSGINVRNSGIFGLYDGSGVGFVDLELGWHFDHIDLPSVKGGASNVIRPSEFQVFGGQAEHGTMALGAVLAQHDNGLAFGIAPKADFLGCVPHRKNGNNNFVPDAIVAALDRLGRGDVLLLEVETIDYLPAEVEDEIFDAIRLCVGAKGVVVIEPAGNGGIDLDGWSLGNDAGVPRRPLNRDIQWDSGALMVGACKAAVTSGAHMRHSDSNYGTRIDASAWGELVYSPSVSPNAYNCFDFTSAASAIIAGAAILVQQIAETTTGAKLAPWRVRSRLGDLGLGTPVIAGRGTTGDSPMPDLVKIAAAMDASPDSFVRDSLADVGLEPNASLNQCPDIIVATAPIPAGALDTEASWGTMPDSAPITPDTDHYIYVRFRGRNEIAAPNTRVSVFWAETSLAAPPNTWHLINQPPVIVNTRPAGPGDPQGPIEVAGPIHWHPRSNQLPPEHPSTHGCMIAMLEHRQDLAPPPLSFVGGAAPAIGWDDFVAYVGQSNNVAYRNFDVVALTLSASEASGDVEFDIHGMQRQASEMAFEIELSGLRKGITFEVHVPPELARAIERANRVALAREGVVDRRIPLAFPSHQRFLRLTRVVLGRQARYRCLARWRVARAVQPTDCTALIRQYYEGKPLGGLTLVLRPSSWQQLRHDKRSDDRPA